MKSSAWALLSWGIHPNNRSASEFEVRAFGVTASRGADSGLLVPIAS